MVISVANKYYNNRTFFVTIITKKQLYLLYVTFTAIIVLVTYNNIKPLKKLIQSGLHKFKYVPLNVEASYISMNVYNDINSSMNMNTKVIHCQSYVLF